MIERAIIFATQAHKGQMRKGTPIPYILHPMEVAAIVAGITTDEEVIVAGLLHDTLEDCKQVTEEEIREQFGERVLSFVRAESEDKSKTWIERKGATLEHIKQEKRWEVRILTLADKLANIRSLARDYEKMGDSIFQCFNQKDPTKIAWYYRGIRDGLSDLHDMIAFREYSALVDYVFKNY